MIVDMLWHLFVISYIFLDIVIDYSPIGYTILILCTNNLTLVLQKFFLKTPGTIHNFASIYQKDLIRIPFNFSAQLFVNETFYFSPWTHISKSKCFSLFFIVDIFDIDGHILQAYVSCVDVMNYITLF